jgi:hypothetical protein
MNGGLCLSCSVTLLKTQKSRLTPKFLPEPMSQLHFQVRKADNQSFKVLLDRWLFSIAKDYLTWKIFVL